MKKLRIIIFCAVVLIALGMLSIPLINNFQADKLRKQLLDMALPEKTEIVESISNAGKISGNGNGMQYFGAILIKSELSLDELQAHYTAVDWNGPYVQEQIGKVINIGYGSLQFSSSPDMDGYYTVYLWGDTDSDILNYDLRGH